MAATTTGVRFARAVLMVRGPEGVASAVNFYHRALGLEVVRHTDEWAELSCVVRDNSSRNDSGSAAPRVTSSFRLSLRSVDGEAQLSTGYSPFLSFDVDDMDRTVATCVQMGGQLDGPIQYPAHGKVAALRSPDGHMIGLYEPALGSQ